MTLTISALSLNDQALSQPFVAHFDASGGTIGRGEQNTLMLPDPERHISRQHARITADGAGYRITNLSSANVVTVAGRALSAGESAPIRHRDQVRIGGFLLEVSDSASSPPQLAARTITEGRAAALAANASAAAGAAGAAGVSARSGGTGAGAQPAMTPVHPPAAQPVAARPASPSAVTPAAPAAPRAAPVDDPFADLFGPPITPASAPPSRPQPTAAATPQSTPHSASPGRSAGAGYGAPAALPGGPPAAARAPLDDPFADLLGPPVAAPVPPGRAAPAAAIPTQPSPAAPGLGAARPVEARPGAAAPADDPFGAFGDFSPVTPLPAAPVGRAPQRSSLDDALGAFVSGAGTTPGSRAAAPGDNDLLAGLGNDPQAARAVDDLLGAPGDGADALAAFLDDGPKTPARGTQPTAGAASNHVHDLNAAFSPSSFDLGRLGGAAAPAPATRPAEPLPAAPGAARARPAGDSAPMPLGPAAVPPARPQPAAPTGNTAARPQAPAPGGIDTRAPAPAAPGGVRLGDQARIHTAPAPLPAAPVARPGVAASASPAAVSMGMSPAVSPAVSPASAPMPLAPGRPQPPVAQLPPQAASRDELWQAFCEAAGVNIDAPQGLSPEMMRVIGQLLRASVDGTVQLMAIRSATKHELRAEMTLIQPRNNNPLKFSPDGHAALELLLQPPMRGFLPGPAAMTDAMHDLVGHSIGTMAGMRAALEGVLGRFAPTQLESKLTGKSMIDSLIPMNRRSRLWELYLQHFEAIRDEAQDDFHTLFGRAFLAAYEQQLDRLHAQQAAATPAPGARKP